MHTLVLLYLARIFGLLSGEMVSGGGGELQMVLMGLQRGTLGVAKLCTGHLVCVYAEVRDGCVFVLFKLYFVSMKFRRVFFDETLVYRLPWGCIFNALGIVYM